MYIGIDPSINDVGMAAVRDTISGPKVVQTVILHPQGNGLAFKLVNLRKLATSRLRDFCNKPQKVIIEWPEYFSSATGVAAAKQGSLIKLVAAATTLIHCCMDAYDVQPTFVTPTVWKGQLPKSVIEKRCKDTIVNPPNNITNHEWDAIGLCLWRLGHL